ncbi:MAG: SDR family NAD(P)-dependent oxidoreductase [Candidatus Eremiobacteraeota bacterium]|nr:SDR family NAD(P)-dependent oxidoreductase [Candidatus Eremiobacteraeota bacterium]
MRRNLLVGAGIAVALFAIVRMAGQLRKYDFRNKVVFLTGGSRGLGLALAREAATRGAVIAICGRDAATLDAAAADLHERGATVLPIACDIRAEAQVAMAVRRVEERFGNIDVAIHNAGTIAVGPVETMTREDYEDALASHFWAAHSLVTRVLPGMKHEGSGRIVLISSIGGKLSVPHLLPYSVSKFALAAFGEGLRAELARYNIGVTTIFPGLMRTGSPRNAYFKSRHQAEYAWFALSDTLPFVSMPAKRAARQIFDATAHNRAEAVLSVPAKTAVTLHALFPGITAGALALAARFMPQPGGVETERRTGAQSESAVTLSPLTALGRKAEREFNQLQR